MEQNNNCDASVSSVTKRLYGDNAGDTLAQEIEGIMAQFPVTTNTLKSAPLSEKDVILIAYPDHVWEVGQPSLSTLSGFCEKYLTNVFSAIHILPFYPSSSDDGFSVKDYYAVDPAYGTWQDIRRLGQSFHLMFDAVFNHMSVQSVWFQKFLDDESPFHDFFVTVQGNPDLSKVIRPRALPLLTEFSNLHQSRKVWTTFSSDQADLNFKNPKVLLAILKVLLFYVSQGARYIRLDAIAFLWKEYGTSCLHLSQTHQIIQLMRTILNRVAPEVLIITETNVPHSDNLSYFGNGHNEAHLIYNFALPPLVLHAIQTGNAITLSKWASTLSTPSSNTCFFNFLASHDGIGLNPVRGLVPESEIDELVKRTMANNGLVSNKNNTDGTQSPYELNTTFFSALNSNTSEDGTAIDRYMVAQAILVSFAGVPGVYFSSIFGAENDRQAADSSGIARRINRQKYSKEILEQELANPRSRAACIWGKYMEMLCVRRSNPSFHPQGRQEVLFLDRRVFGLVRSSPNERQHVLCLHNLSAEPVRVTLTSQYHTGTSCFTSSFIKTEPINFPEVQLSPYQALWIQIDY